MKHALTLALAAVMTAPAWCSDVVVTRAKHTDAAQVMGENQPAKDSTEVTWIGKDRMRIEDGNDVTIVRTDLKKMYMLDMQAKTFTALDLPVDIEKLLPADMAPMMQMVKQMKVTVTPTQETKKIKDWNTTHYTVTTTLPMGGESVQELWVTQDLTVDAAAWRDMHSALMSANPFTSGMTEELKKVVGVPVLVERTQKMMNSEVKSTETLVSAEEKEPATGLYDLPQGFTEKPFDPMAKIGRMGGPGRRPH